LILGHFSTLLQEAKPQPDFSGHKIINNPRLDSHLRDPSLLPPAATGDRRYITSFDPATGIHLKTFMADNEADIFTKIQTAAAAAKTWASSTFPERKRVIKSLKRWLVENQDTCARVVCRDTGKTCQFMMLLCRVIA
jgi:acyl-CoA reductase-like NAD-dependent aldehyde dehydrogenase